MAGSDKEDCGTGGNGVDGGGEDEPLGFCCCCCICCCCCWKNCIIDAIDGDCACCGASPEGAGTAAAMGIGATVAPVAVFTNGNGNANGYAGEIVGEFSPE